ncbi:hypothetical protein PAPYR_12216 [Paratrimastix pyriformis]|uniref:Uncharacterized protein n=1 Tax=Paratrimastix pyriformis TaxID=342808 RepID=A0ABQ8U282_9EUKA|nr:hypothetical protein PAPYR_12216 [Paratrimastix pyriformis]
MNANTASTWINGPLTTVGLSTFNAGIVTPSLTFNNADNTTAIIKSNGELNYISDVDIDDTTPVHTFINGATTLMSIYTSRTEFKHPVISTIFSSTNDGIGTKIGMNGWNNNTWAIYRANSGAGNSYSAASACAGYGTIANAIRFRAYDATSTGFLFENSNEKCLMSVNANTAETWINGPLTTVGSTTLNAGLKLPSITSGYLYSDSNGNISATTNVTSSTQTCVAPSGTATTIKSINNSVIIDGDAGQSYYNSNNNNNAVIIKASDSQSMSTSILPQANYTFQ